MFKEMTLIGGDMVRIGHDILIKNCGRERNSIKLGINAPLNVLVMRLEIIPSDGSTYEKKPVAAPKLKPLPVVIYKKKRSAKSAP